MTDTAAKPSLDERIGEWLRHEAHSLNLKGLFREMAGRLHELEHRVALLEGVAVKDAPAVVHVVNNAVPVIAEVVADVQKATGA